MSKPVFMIKFSVRNQLYNNKHARYFYNREKADKLVDKYEKDEYHYADLHIIHPED